MIGECEICERPDVEVRVAQVSGEETLEICDECHESLFDTGMVHTAWKDLRPAE